jgi:hypothetical protein
MSIVKIIKQREFIVFQSIKFPKPRALRSVEVSNGN